MATQSQPVAQTILAETASAEDDDPGAANQSAMDEPPPTSDHSQGFIIEINADDADTEPPALGWLEPHLHQAADLLGITQGHLSIALLGDDAMSQAHEQFSSVAGPTDVLTFDLSEPGEAGASAGVIEAELLLGVGEAQRQAQPREREARLELLLYAVHGLLHLLGEDDHTDEDYAQMHAREDALLCELGLGPLFAGKQFADTKFADSESSEREQKQDSQADA